MMDTSADVLIVDDYKTMLRIVRNLLKQIHFHNVDEASDGRRRWRSCAPAISAW